MNDTTTTTTLPAMRDTHTAAVALVNGLARIVEDAVARHIAALVQSGQLDAVLGASLERFAERLDALDGRMDDAESMASEALETAEDVSASLEDAVSEDDVRDIVSDVGPDMVHDIVQDVIPDAVRATLRRAFDNI